MLSRRVPECRPKRFVRQGAGTDSMFVGRPSEVTRSAATLKVTLRSGSSSVGEGSHSWTSVPTQSVFWVIRRVLTESAKETAALLDSTDGHGTKYSGIVVRLCWLREE